MENKISIIVPAFNIENDIKKCLLSITSQSYPNFEVVCVNDGSSDGTLSEIESIAKHDERIKIITIENSGANHARYIGLIKSVSDYVSFIDGDDWIEPNYLKKMHDAIVESESDIAMCGYIRVDEDGNELKRGSYGNKTVDHIEFANILFDGILGSTNWGKLYKRNILPIDDFEIPRHLSIKEDAIMNVKVMKHEPKVQFVNESMYFYKVRSGSLSSSKKPTEYEIEFSKYFVEIAKSYNVYDTHIKVINTFVTTFCISAIVVDIYKARLKKSVFLTTVDFINNHNRNNLPLIRKFIYLLLRMGSSVLK